MHENMYYTIFWLQLHAKNFEKKFVKTSTQTNFYKKREGKSVSFILVAYYMHERNFDYPVPLVEEVGFLKLMVTDKTIVKWKRKYTSSSLFFC